MLKLFFLIKRFYIEGAWRTSRGPMVTMGGGGHGHQGGESKKCFRADARKIMALQIGLIRPWFIYSKLYLDAMFQILFIYFRLSYLHIDIDI